MKVFFLISNRIFHILTQKSPIFFIRNVQSYFLCHNQKFNKIFVKNIFPGDDFSCNFENEEISSEVLRAEAFNSKNL